MEPCSFRQDSVKVTEFDAGEFLEAWDLGMLHHQGGGIYGFREGGSREQFFWSGRTDERPRSFRLWVEPVIAVGAMARLHLTFGWPERLIRTQSVDGAFDVVATLSSGENEHIAAEVKKSAKEINDLISLMKAYGSDPRCPEPPSGKERNAFRKVTALRKRKAPIFCAIGPGGICDVFSVRYLDDEVLGLQEATTDELRYPFEGRIS